MTETIVKTRFFSIRYLRKEKFSSENVKIERTPPKTFPSFFWHSNTQDGFQTAIHLGSDPQRVIDVFRTWLGEEKKI